MTKNTPIDKQIKLTVLCRIEPGCLGPDGIDHIESFCRFANAELKKFKANYITWLPLPRYDKSLAEIQYSVNGKQLTQVQAKQYLTHFDYVIDEFEESFHDHLSEMIDTFLAQK